MPSDAQLRYATPRLRFTVAVSAGTVVGALVATTSAKAIGPLAGWDTAAIIYVTWAWILMARLDPEETSLLAVREDSGAPRWMQSC